MFKILLNKTSPFFSFSRKGFQAIRNNSVQSQVLKGKSQKLDALIQVVLSLSSKQLSYLNQLQSKRSLANGQSILTNKIFSIDGQKHTPLQYVYQNHWINKNWKQTHLLTTLLVSQDLQDAKQEQQVVKQIWEIQLTSVDASQKIKIIKVLREMFNLGLKQAKQIADKTPSLIKRQRKDQAQKIKEALEKQGCVITLK